MNRDLLSQLFCFRSVVLSIFCPVTIQSNLIMSEAKTEKRYELPLLVTQKCFFKNKNRQYSGRKVGQIKSKPT